MPRFAEEGAERLRALWKDGQARTFPPAWEVDAMRVGWGHRRVAYSRPPISGNDTSGSRTSGPSTCQTSASGGQPKYGASHQ